ncbi:hypothetical protein AALA83_16975, partial [Oscillospiraceae bacterium 44-5]
HISSFLYFRTYHRFVQYLFFKQALGVLLVRQIVEAHHGTVDSGFAAVTSEQAKEAVLTPCVGA